MKVDKGTDITKRHSIFFEKFNFQKLASLLNDIYLSGKSQELLSFMTWEIIHKLGLFPRKSYLEFNNIRPFLLSNMDFEKKEFDEGLKNHFRNNDLELVDCGYNWKCFFVSQDGKMVGCLYPDDRSLYKSSEGGNSIEFMTKFPENIKSIFISSQKTILVSTKGAIYRGKDDSQSFEKVIELGSSESFFRHNYAMTETPDHILVMGEYGNVWENNGWRNLANLYFSYNDGISWDKSDFLIRRGINKHVHIVKYSRIINKILLTDGDNKKKLWLGEPLNSRDFKTLKWRPVTKLHIQTGGYTSVVENDYSIFFGTDYQGGTNFLIETKDGRKLNKKIVPDPYRRSPIHGLIMRKSQVGSEIWANLPYSTANTKCLLMFSRNGGKSWGKVIEYNGNTHSISLINASDENLNELYFSIKDSKNNIRRVYKIVDRE